MYKIDEDPELHRIECECKDYNHSIRLSYYKEDWYVGLEFSLTKFPNHTRVNIKWPKLSKLYRYIKSIWWSIKGRPSWYSAEILLMQPQIFEIREFLDKCLQTYEKPFRETIC